MSDEGTSPPDAGVSVVRDAARRAEERADRNKVVGLEGSRQTTLRRRRAMIQLVQGQGLLFVLIGLIVTFWATSPYFMTAGNWSVIAQISAVLGILAVSQTLLIVSGGIDISVGSGVACSSALIAYLVLNHVTPLEATAIVLIGGAVVGLVNGTIIVKLGVNPLVTTLGMYSALLGLAYVIIGPESVPVSSGLYTFLSSSALNYIPVAFIIFALMVIGGIFVSRQTAVGRHIYALGDNEEAAIRAGINTQRVRLGLFVLSGFIAAFAGVLTTAQLSSGSAQVGGTYLLSVVTAVVLGGTRLSGGRGGLFGTFVAVMILAVLQNGFALLEVNAYLQDVVLGFLLIVAVLVDQTASRFERR